MKKLKDIAESKKHLPVMGYLCNNYDEYYYVGVVNKWDFETPKVAIGKLDGHYVSYSVCKIKNGKCEYLTNDFPEEVLEYLEKHNIELE